MLSIYCPACGNKNEYALKKPSFCGGCGVPFDISAENLLATQKTVPVKKITRPIAANIEDEEEFTGELPNITKIEVDIVPDRPFKTSLADVIATNAGHSPDVRRNIPKKVSRKRILEELKQESQSAARPQTIGD